MKNKKILIGISGSIAAYKTCYLIRNLIKLGAEVRVVITQSASHFVAPVTLSTLSKNPVYSDFFKKDSSEWNNHVDLALWADIFIIAPASANTIGKMANGICDNFLMAVYFSCKCPVWFAPAMDLDMFVHPAIQQNMKKLQEFGNNLIDAEEGELASGLVGKGRMAEPETITNLIIKHFA